MTQCSSCGKENRDGAGFCRHCGQELLHDNPAAEGTGDRAASTLSLEEAVTLLLPQENQAGPPVVDEDAATLIESKAAGQENNEIAGDPVEVETQAQRTTEAVGTLENNEVGGNPGETIALEHLDLDETEGAPLGDGSDKHKLGSNVPSGVSTGGDLEHPLTLGVVIHDRYRVLSVVSEGDPDIIYEVQDLLLCWNCGQVNQTVDEVYCWDCGAALEQKLSVQLRETPLSETVEEAKTSGTGFQVGGYSYDLVTPQDEDGEQHPPAFRISVGFQSDAGKLREVDEDSLLVLQANALCEMQTAPSMGFFAVADGIGGHQAGEIASQIVIRSLAANVLEHIFVPAMSTDFYEKDALKELLKTAVHDANQDLLAARKTESRDMGCTLTAVLVCDNQAVVINVGDSRTYLMRMGALSQITEDHSMVAKLLAQGLIEPGEVFTHEQKSVIYRSMGEKADLELEDASFEFNLEPGDRLLLCCDGLWEMVPDRFIEDLLLEYFDPQAACDRLVEMANQAGGEDNISLIILNFQALKRFR